MMPQLYSSPARRPQLDLFPTPVHVEHAEPTEVIGPRTRVRGIYRVRYGNEARIHLVLDDRHGWYCAEHGPECEAVSDARRASGG